MFSLRHAVSAGVAVLLFAEAAPVSSHNPVTTTVVFNREVAAVLNQKCAQCHVADGMAMPLQTYAEVRPWAVAIKEEILARRMPPWQAERGFGLFANDVSLTPREQEFLISWIEGGVPPGEGEPPPHMDHSGHWMLGQPDGLYTAKPAPASPPRPGYTRFTVDTGLKKDTWVRAIDFKPAGKRSMRAAFFSVAGTGQYLGGWTPWASSTELPDGTAFTLPANAVIVIDVLHGMAEVKGAPALALYFAKAASRPISSLALTASGSSPDGRLRATTTLAVDQTLLALRTELSEGAKSVELKAMRPEGSVEPLLWIRNFRPEWQTPYVLKAPVALPRGSTLMATATFDGAATTPRMEITVNATRVD